MEPAAKQAMLAGRVPFDWSYRQEISSSPGRPFAVASSKAALDHPHNALPTIRIELSPRSPAPIRRALALKSSKGRRKTGYYLIEGVRGALDALERTPSVIEVLISDAATGESISSLGCAAERRGVPVHTVAERDFRRIAQVVHTQGVAAIARKPPDPAPETPLLPRGPAIAVVLDGVRDPGNIGTILRTVDAAGCAGLILTPGSGDLYNPKVVRAAFGSLINLPSRYLPPEAIVAAACAEEASLVLLDPEEGVPLQEFQAPERMILVAGGEPDGAGRTIRRSATSRLSFDLLGGVESLNVAVATGIALFACRDRRPLRKVQR